MKASYRSLNYNPMFSPLDVYAHTPLGLSNVLNPNFFCHNTFSDPNFLTSLTDQKHFSDPKMYLTLQTPFESKSYPS